MLFFKAIMRTDRPISDPTGESQLVAPFTAGPFGYPETFSSILKGPFPWIKKSLKKYQTLF